MEQETGIQKLVNVLKSHNVEFVFAITGTDIYRLLEGVENQGIRVIDMRSEAAAAYAALGVGKMTGRPGIVMVTAGPGVTNTFTAALEAKYDHIPIIIFSGAPATRDRKIGALHDLNHPLVMQPVCKKTFSVENTEELIGVVKKAFQVASSDTPGSVYVQLPKDVLEPYKFVAVPIRSEDDSWNFFGPSSLRTFDDLENEEDILPPIQSNKAVDNDLTPLAVRFPIATADQINISAKILESAKRPLIIFEAKIVPLRTPELPSIIQSLGVPCYLLRTASGLLGKSHDLLLQYSMMEIIAQADVVILAEKPCDWRFNYGRGLPKDGKIITVGRDRKTLTLNAPKIWKPTQIVRAHAGHYLVDVAKVYNKSSSLQEESWIKTCRELDAKGQKLFEDKAKETPADHLNPLKLCFAAKNVAPDDAIFVVETGDFATSFLTVIERPGPLSYIGTEFSNIGVGIGVAIGVKLCSPNSNVWLVTGDGAIGYHITEFDTCVRHKIPILVLVGNDASYYEIARNEIKEYGTDVGSALSYSHYEEIAKTFGAKGFLLDRSNESKMEEVLRKAIKTNREGFSVLVNAFLGKIVVWTGKA